MRLTYYGHACFAVEVSGSTLLFDPFITPNPLAKHVSIDQIKADFIAISHGHADHIADAVDLAQQTGAMVVSNYEIASWLAHKGVRHTRAMNHGGSANLKFGKIQYVNAIHSSSLPDGTYGGHPGGFVVQSHAGNFYYSGDTALTADMKLIGEAANLNFAVLCIGDNFTMGAEDAARAAGFVGCDTVVGVHYDTFAPIQIDHQQAIDAFAAAGKQLHLVDIGKSIEL